jgi:hypothetical protein
LSRNTTSKPAEASGGRAQRHKAGSQFQRCVNEETSINHYDNKERCKNDISKCSNEISIETIGMVDKCISKGQ